MKAVLYCLLTCFIFSCHKDEEMSLDNYIAFDGVMYLRKVDSKGIYNCTAFPPYYNGVTWSETYYNSTIVVSVANTCSNNRGVLSNFYGFITFTLHNGQDSSEYYGKFPQFEVKYSETNKASIAFHQLKVYRIYNHFLDVNDSADYKTVSGRVTFQ